MDPAALTFRPANRSDAAAIRNLIRRVHINPWDLDWRRFLVATDRSGALIACGQLKPHGSDVLELASIAVEPAYRRNGVARRVIDALIERAPRPLYLTCRSHLGSMYAKWGFREVRPEEMPRYFSRLTRLVTVATRLAHLPGRLLVMVLE